MAMVCKYSDGLKVDYSGSLHITKGKDVELALKEEDIPDNFKGDLREAAFHNNCEELRHVALEVTDAVGSFIP
jgi:hypothetical protein